MTRTESAHRFLRTLLGEIPPDSCLEIRVALPDGTVTPQFFGRIEDVRVEHFPPSARVWFGPALRLANAAHGRKSDLTWASCVWVDLDAYDEPREAVIRRVLGSPLPPTYVVDSGGGFHVYWRLDRALDLRTPQHLTFLEEVNYGLAHLLRGDPSARDAARMMGLPGTCNPGDGHRKTYDPPRERTIVHEDARAVYPVEAVSRYRRQFRPTAVAVAPATTPPVPAPDLATLRVPPRLIPLIRHGWQPGCGYASRSELDSAVVVAMLRAEHTEEEIRAVFRAYGIGAKYREKGKDGDRYLARTIASAREWIVSEDGPRIGDIREAADGGLEVRRERRWERIFDRPIRATAYFEGEDVGFVVSIPSSGGADAVTRLLRSEDFATLSAFRRALGLAGAWTGDDRDVQRLILYLRSQQPPTRRAVRTIGWADADGDIVVFPNAQLVRGEFVGSVDYLYVGDMPNARLEDAADWPALARAVAELIPKLHEPGAVLAITGWFVATFAAPWVRRHTSATMQFPHLFVRGLPGAGKTTLLDLHMRMAGNAASDTSGITPWAAVKLLGSSNTLPAFFDEHRAERVRWMSTALYPILREAYNAKWHTRGLASLGTIRIRLQSPVVIAGETPYRDPALVERTVIVPLEPELRNRDALAQFQALPLHEFNGGMYRYLRSAAGNLSEVWREAERLVPPGQTVSDRQLHAWRVVAFGLLLLRPYWPRPAERLVQRVLEYAGPVATGAGADAPDEVVHEAVRVLAELVKARRIREGFEFAIRDGRYLWFVPTLVLPLIEEYFSRVPTELPMARDVIRQRMAADAKRAGSMISSVGDRFRLQSTRQVRGIAIDLQRVEDILDIPVDYWLTGGVLTSGGEA